MKLVYGITVSDEREEVLRLLKQIKENTKDEIVVQMDHYKFSEELFVEIAKYTTKVYSYGFKNDFADFKNRLTNTCVNYGADFVFQLDADEMITEKMIKNIKQIIEPYESNVDGIYVPRINTVDGITENDIKVWNWKINEKGWVNHPDYQGRIYRSNLEWCGTVHEKICGDNLKWWALPTEDDYSIIHHKDIAKQINQNNLYKQLQNG